MINVLLIDMEIFVVGFIDRGGGYQFSNIDLDSNQGIITIGGGVMEGNKTIEKCETGKEFCLLN